MDIKILVLASCVPSDVFPVFGAFVLQLNQRANTGHMLCWIRAEFFNLGARSKHRRASSRQTNSFNFSHLQISFHFFGPACRRRPWPPTRNLLTTRMIRTLLATALRSRERMELLQLLLMARKRRRKTSLAFIPLGFGMFFAASLSNYSHMR